jgi:hypothetical protein
LRKSGCCTGPEAFPEGQIRGQLVPVSLADQSRESSIGKFEGKADPGKEGAGGISSQADVRVEARFAVNGTVDLASSVVAASARLGSRLDPLVTSHLADSTLELFFGAEIGKRDDRRPVPSEVSR